MERQFKLEILNSLEKENESQISKKEIVRISSEEVVSRIFNIFKKVEGDKVYSLVSDSTYNPDDNFFIKDKISLIDNSMVGIGGAKEYPIEIELNGKLKNLNDEYKSNLEQKLKNLVLNNNQLYALYNWDHELSVFDKNEENIDNDTKLKSSFEGNFIREGNPFK